MVWWLVVVASWVVALGVWPALVVGVGDQQDQHWGVLDEGDFGGVA